jgi:hypothetical protein
VYLICLVVGGGLLIISTVFGGDQDLGVDGGDAVGGMDLEVDGDLDLDLDGDAPMDGVTAGHGPSVFALSNWFSLSFVVYFAAVFGLFGTLLTWLSPMGPVLILLVAGVAGVAMGQAVHQLLRYLKRSSGNSSTQIGDYINRPARVTVAIRPPARGEVAVAVRGHERFLAAATRRDDDHFEVGDRVVITGYASGTAMVVSQAEHEFLADSTRKEDGAT